MVFACLFTEPNFRIFSAPAHFALSFNMVISREVAFMVEQGQGLGHLITALATSCLAPTICQVSSKHYLLS